MKPDTKIPVLYKKRGAKLIARSRVSGLRNALDWKTSKAEDPRHVYNLYGQQTWFADIQIR